MTTREAAIAIDTTGIRRFAPSPPSPPTWTPRVVGLGLALVHPENGIVESFGTLIHQPKDHVARNEARRAWEVNGIDPADVIACTFTAQAAAGALRSWWADRGKPRLRGYPNDFVRAFLTDAPWFVPADVWGTCVMQEAASRLPGGGGGRLALAKAQARLADMGFDTAAPWDATTRAHSSAVIVAKIILALRTLPGA